MNCKIEKTKISGRIICPPNKSYTHRAVFIASLVNGESRINNALRASDTNATIKACKIFGAHIKGNNSELTVRGVNQPHKNDIKIDASNSGTTIRVAAAISSLFKIKTTLTGDESLLQRPMQPLLDALESLGAKCSSNNGKPPMTVVGTITGGDVLVTGEISSQFISALLIAAPLTEKGVTINIDGNLVSKPYLDATISSMKQFGVNVEIKNPYKKYRINPNKYQPTIFTVPSDFSSLGLLLSAAVLLGDENFTIEITVGNLPQGDEVIIDMLKKMGVKITVEKNSITVNSPKLLGGGKFDLSNTPDLLPALAILALKTSRPIELYNVKHARYKETDRISILAKELQKLGTKVDEKEDGLVLNAPDDPNGAFLDSHNDHRLFMAFCIAGMYVGNCIVSNAESVDVSYPNFIADIKKVGGNLQTV